MIDEKKLLEDINYYISHTRDDSGEHYAYQQIKKLIKRQPKIIEWISCKQESPNILQNVMLLTNSREVLVGAFAPGFGPMHQDVFICNDGIRQISDIEYWSQFPTYKTPEWQQKIINVFLAEN